MFWIESPSSPGLETRLSRVDLVGQGSNRELSERLGRLRSEIQALTDESAPVAPGPHRLRRPSGQMANAIETVLASVKELRARDIHAAVGVVLDEEVSPSSVKNCLATHSRGPDPMFVRTGRGRYRLR
jgi:hypothetical protein